MGAIIIVLAGPTEYIAKHDGCLSSLPSRLLHYTHKHALVTIIIIIVTAIGIILNIIVGDSIIRRVFTIVVTGVAYQTHSYIVFTTIAITIATLTRIVIIIIDSYTIIISI